MARNISIWLNDDKFAEMAKIKALSNLTWAQILELGVFALEKTGIKSNVEMGSGNWDKLFKNTIR